MSQASFSNIYIYESIKTYVCNSHVFQPSADRSARETKN